MTLKTIVFCASFGILSSIQGQTFAELLKLGKDQFFSEEFNKACNTLEKAIAINPDNQEVHYYLGYSIDKINSPYAEYFPQIDLIFTSLASEEFEAATRCSSTYTGDSIIIDPYFRISSTWGSLAFKYLYYGKKDSAIWALRQGKNRGGFGNFLLNFNRINMEKCDKNAFLLVNGDKHVFYCLYLQLVEKYRTDIMVITPNLLQTSWYPKLLKKNFNIQFDMSQKEIDSCKLKEWKDSLVTINNFTWTIKPSYKNQYLTRSNLLLLSILKKNNLKNEINFTMDYPYNEYINLNDSLLYFYTMYRISTSNYEETIDSLLIGFNNYLNLHEYINPKSRMEALAYERIQYRTLEFIDFIQTNVSSEDATKLMDLFIKYRKIYKQPFVEEGMQNYYNYVIDHLIKN